MAYIVIALIGMAGGAFCVYMILETQRKKLREQTQEHATRAREVENAEQSLKVKRKVFDEGIHSFQG